MESFKEMLRSLRSLFRRRREEQQLSEEFQFHLERQSDQNQALGMSSEDARYAALRLFGGVQQIKEECREARGITTIESLVQDLFDQFVQWLRELTEDFYGHVSLHLD